MKYVGIILAVAVIASAITGGAYWFRQKQQADQARQTAVSAEPPTPVPAQENETWKDQSQFTFQYPKGLTVNPHEEDTKNYAHVELTHPQHPGHIIAWTKDATAQSIDDWVKKEKLTTAIDTTLGGLPAKKTLGEKENTQFISTIQGGYLYQIESDLADRSFWEPVLTQIIASYSFTESEAAPAEKAVNPQPAADDSSGDYIEEEVIE